MEKWTIRIENLDDHTHVDYQYPVFTSDEAENAVRLLRLALREMSAIRWCITILDETGGYVDSWYFDDDIEEV